MPDTLVSSLPDPLAARIASERCAACDAERTGAFCAACGERAPRLEDESLSAFLRDQFHEVTSADGRLWRTLRRLFQPGQLTAEFFSGRRSLYLRPIRLFLVLNVVLFFALGFLNQNPLKGELSTQLGSLGNPAVEAVETRIEAWGGDEALFTALFDQRASTLSSTLIVLFIPAFALLLPLTYGRRTGTRHLVFATYVISALVGLYLAVVVGLFAVVWIAAHVGVEEFVLGPWLNWPLAVLFLGSVSALIARSSLRVYEVRPARAWVAGLALAGVGLPVLLVGYRALLFWVTLATLDLPRPT